MNEESKVLNEQELETTDTATKKGPTKSELTARVTELEQQLKVATSQIEAAEKALVERDKYIDKLYDNSNQLTNKYEITKTQVKAIKNLAKITRDVLNLLDERIIATENFLNN